MHLIPRKQKMFFDRWYYCISLGYHLCRYRKTEWWHTMDEKVILGGIPLHEYQDQTMLIDVHHVKSVLSLNEDFEFTPSSFSTPVTGQEWQDKNIIFLQIPIPDGKTPSFQGLEMASNFIVTAPGPVYVHCKAGVGRSVMAVMAYFIDHKGFTARQCKEWIKARREHINLSPLQWEVIKNYETRRHIKILSPIE